MKGKLPILRSSLHKHISSVRNAGNSVLRVKMEKSLWGACPSPQQMFMALKGTCISQSPFVKNSWICRCPLAIFKFSCHDLIFHCNCRSTGNKGCPSFLYTVFSVIFGSMAMLVKEHGITVFGVCIVYDCLVINKRFLLR